VVVVMQQLHYSIKTFFRLPGETRGNDGKAHQAAAASEKAEGDLNRRIRTVCPVVWEGRP